MYFDHFKTIEALETIFNDNPVKLKVMITRLFPLLYRYFDIVTSNIAYGNKLLFYINKYHLGISKTYNVAKKLIKYHLKHRIPRIYFAIKNLKKMK
ncbi:MAG: hypothetical protein Ta2B_17130 [Termitinemataceae bacterium]|nr:MAG: hypothetical protein Ta2B_17130 [Termitinemataceae bacterium]